VTHDLTLAFACYGAGVAATLAGMVISDVLRHRHHLVRGSDLVPEERTIQPKGSRRRHLPTAEQLAAEKMTLAARILARHRREQDGTTW